MRAYLGDKADLQCPLPLKPAIDHFYVSGLSASVSNLDSGAIERLFTQYKGAHGPGWTLVYGRIGTSIRGATLAEAGSTSNVRGTTAAGAGSEHVNHQPTSCRCASHAQTRMKTASLLRACSASAR